jgi:hypothetical protein
VNGDGYSDVIVGADGYDNGEFDEGRAFVYHGSASGPGASAAWTAESNILSSQFSFSVAGAGDVDGDGFSDVVVGAPFAPDQGYAFVYRGSVTGLAGTVSTQLENNGSLWYGHSVGSAGDTNGDGFADVIVGAPETGFSGGLAHGEWFLYLGNKNLLGSSTAFRNAGLDRRARQARAGDEAPIALLGKSDYQDVFRLQANGRTAAGRGRVRIEWEVKPRGVAFNGTGLARSVQSADTGVPVAPLGSFVSLDEILGGLQNGTAYRWRARILSDSPYFPRTPWLSMAGNSVTEIDFRTAGPLLDAAPADAPSVVRAVVLDPIHPQPFTAGHALSFSLAEAGEVRLALYDARGRERAILDSGIRGVGTHTVRWDGRDRAGRPLPAGMYFLWLRVGAHAEGHKLVWAP